MTSRVRQGRHGAYLGQLGAPATILIVTGTVRCCVAWQGRLWYPHTRVGPRVSQRGLPKLPAPRHTDVRNNGMQRNRMRQYRTSMAATTFPMRWLNFASSFKRAVLRNDVHHINNHCASLTTTQPRVSSPALDLLGQACGVAHPQQ